MADNRPIKLIYVAGYGRSGTTLLDIAIGQQPGVFAAGEITVLARHAWEHGEFCACRRPVRECEFWAPVVERWQSRREPGALKAYGRLLARSEWLFSFGRALARLRPSTRQRAYAEQTGDLLRAIARESGAEVIVDSSKLPGRAAAMATIPGVELYLVHVVRDGRGVAWSMQKPYKREVAAGIQKELKPKPLWYTAARWVVVNAGVELLRWRLPRGRSMRLRYEDFVSDPAAAVARIMDLVGGEYVVPAHGGDVLKPQHQVAGSRHRMNDEIRIRKDVGWTTRMPDVAKAVFSILAGPLLWRYGYFRASGTDGASTRSADRPIAERIA